MSQDRRIENLPCDFVALDVATIIVLESFPPGWVRYRREERKSGKAVIFYLIDDAGHDGYGSIRLFYQHRNLCTLAFHDPSPEKAAWKNRYDDTVKAFLQRLSQEHIWTQTPVVLAL